MSMVVKARLTKRIQNEEWVGRWGGMDLDLGGHGSGSGAVGTGGMGGCI